MSRSNYFVIQLHSTKSPIDPKAVIKLLMGRGWKIRRDKGPIIYLPIDDNDMFDWRRDGIAESDFWEIIDIQYSKNERIGVQLSWKGNGPGLDLFITTSQEQGDYYLDMNIGMDGSRKDLMPEIWLPDYNWYTQRILPCLWEKYYIPQYSLNFAF
jgi:hypothetical protein